MFNLEYLYEFIHVIKKDYKKNRKILETFKNTINITNYISY